MQALRLSLRPLCSHAYATGCTQRCLSTIPAPSSVPWFVDPSDVPSPQPPATSQSRQQTVRQSQQNLAHILPLPTGIAPHTPLARLHARLSGSPFLEPGTLLVTRPLPTEVGPPLPPAGPKGRRKRGRTYVGEGLEGEEEAGLWRWIVIAEVCIVLPSSGWPLVPFFMMENIDISFCLQVKEGTENRGAIDSVVRQVRQSVCLYISL
jgi:hypothetical protein